MSTDKKRKFKLPHIFVLLTGIIIVCAILTWILPAGEFDRQTNAAGTEVVVPGTYHTVDASPVGPFETLKSLYNGMLNGGGVIFFVFIAYAAIGLIISTGAFNGLVSGLLKILKGKARAVIIPIFILVLGCISSTIGVFEEAFPFIPIFVGIAIAMGYDALVGLGIVALGVGLGYSGAVMNPFTVGMAQDIAGIPQMSGIGFRIICHVVMIIVASTLLIRYALKIQADPTKSYVYGDDFSHMEMDPQGIEHHSFGIREKAVLAVLALGVVVIVWGVKTKGWYFEDLSAVFLLMGIISSFIMGWGPDTIAQKMAASFTDIAVACMIIGFSRGILVVLQSGHIIDTIVYGISIPLGKFPAWIASELMLIVQTLLNFLIPSGSGQAVTSMPIMAPLADLIGVSRQVSVLAFQFGDGLSNIIWPTAMAPIMCGIAGIKIEKWWKLIVPIFLALLVTQGVLIAVATIVF